MIIDPTLLSVILYTSVGILLGYLLKTAIAKIAIEKLRKYNKRLSSMNRKLSLENKWNDEMESQINTLQKE